MLNKYIYDNKMFSLKKKDMITLLFYCFLILLIGLVFIYLDRNYNDSRLKTDAKIYDLGNGKKILGQEMLANREEEPRMLKTVGSKLLCDVAGELTQQKVLTDFKLPNTRSPISGIQLMADCYLDNLNLAFDYSPKEIYEYDRPNNITRNIYEFYNRLAIKASKKDQLQDKDIKLIEIPYHVDMCIKDGNNYTCEDRVDMNVRKDRIRNYLKDNIKEVLEIY